VEYFVVVNSVRRKRPGRGGGRTASGGSSSGGGGDDAGDIGNDDGRGGDLLRQQQQQSNREGGECPPSPPPAVPGMMASGSPRQSPRQSPGPSPRPSPRPGRKLSDAVCHNQSPKVQQRINFRRIHLPQQGSDDSDGGGGDGGDRSDQLTAAAALFPHDAGDEGASNAASSSPAGDDGRKKPARSLSQSRLFKGSKIRSCAAAIGEGRPPLRLPVLDHSERDSLTSEGESTFDESDDEDVGGVEGDFGRGGASGGDAAARIANGEINFGKAAPLPDLDDPVPRKNGEDAPVASSSLVEKPPLHPTPSQQHTARWQREGGASVNIRMPGGGADVDGDGHAYAGNDAMGESPVGGGAELCFEPSVTSRYPLEDYPDDKLNELAVAQFCNPSSDVIELTTEYCMPRVHHFVLTNEKGRKIYGTCLTIYEEFEAPDDGRDLTPEELELLEWYRSHAGTVQYAAEDGVEVTFHRNAGRATLYLPRMLCLLSTWPYLTAFREYLTQLYRIATTTDQMTAPLERYILNICKEVPAPPPGAFEVRMDILDSAIRFWAPPANQPIAYVALPFEILFECLDISNVLFVWYSLTLERNVLLVSSQCSILTVCAEILCSLLFPMQWSHLYIPTIPRFLTPMLDAPMPYLCGITRENLFYAVGDVSDETIVVDLDQNVITAGPYTPELPPIPHRRRHKLETALEQHVGEVFWNARGLHKHEVDKVKNSKKSNAKERLEDVLDGAELTWSLRLKGFDEAFNLAYAPDSYNNLNDSPLPSNLSMCQSEDETTDMHQSQYDAVQEAFLRFFVAALKGYRRFLTLEDAPDDEGLGVPSSLSNRTARPIFRSEDFVASQKSGEFQPFLQEFVLTQQFDDFITKRMYSPGEPDVTFFDQSIDEKNNRSKLKLNKTETPFLQSTKSHKALKSVYAVEPNAHDLPDENNGIEWSLSTIYSPTAQQKKRFVYSAWPEKLKPELFGASRPMPEIITAEFDRQAAIVAKIRSNYIDEDEESQIWDLYASECDPSPEIASFTVFFLLYCAAIGRELEAIEDKRKKLNLDRTIYDIPTSSPKSEAIDTATAAKQITTKDENADGKEEGVLSFIPDCPADVCCALSDLPNYKDLLATFSLMMKSDEDQDVEEVIVKEEPTRKEVPRKKFDRFDQLALFAAELEESRVRVHAQLNLAFDVLGMMGARLLLADPDVYKYMMEACGRCGDAERATQLMEVVQEEGLVADSEMYSCFVSAFATNPGHSPYLRNEANQLHTQQQQQQQQQLSRRHMASSSIPFLPPMPSNSLTRKRSTEKTRQDFINSVNLALSMSSDGSAKSGSGGSHSADTETPLGTEAEYSSNAASGKQLRESIAMKKKRSRNKSVTSLDPDSIVVTDAVAMHVTLGESLLSLLYPNVSIDTDSDSCPKCSRVLTEDEITAGWVSCAFKDYTTGCPQCHHRFVPSFAVFCSSPTFVGSQGKGTPLYCELLSPWVLRKEIHNILRQHDGIDVILQPGWRRESDINATLWWNLIVCFNRYKLPLSFLLQGSFQNRLTLPAI